MKISYLHMCNQKETTIDLWDGDEEENYENGWFIIKVYINVNYKKAIRI